MQILQWTSYNRYYEDFHTNWLRPILQPFLPPHRHEYAEIFFVERAAGLHQVNGRSQQIGKGDLVFIRPYRDIHCISECDDDFSILHIAIQTDSIRHIETRYFSSPDFWGGDSVVPTLVRLSEAQQIWFEKNFRRLMNAPKKLIRIERFLMELLDEVTSGQEFDHLKEPSDWVQSICDRIIDPRYFSLGSKALSILANRSPEHVARELKRRTGKTPSEVVNAARIEFARQELLSSSKEILEIAMECGFNSISHFYKIFKEKVGLTPAQYRKEFRELPAQTFF